MILVEIETLIFSTLVNIKQILRMKERVQGLKSIKPILYYIFIVLY